MKHEESKIQSAIVRYLQEVGIFAFSIPNEFVKDARSMGTAISLGLKPGVADLCVMVPGGVIFLEVKTATGVQSERQKKFEARCKDLGIRYHVVRSVKDVESLI